MKVSGPLCRRRFMSLFVHQGTPSGSTDTWTSSSKMVRRTSLFYKDSSDVHPEELLLHQPSLIQQVSVMMLRVRLLTAGEFDLINGDQYRRVIHEFLFSVFHRHFRIVRFTMLTCCNMCCVGGGGGAQHPNEEQHIPNMFIYMFEHKKQNRKQIIKK